MKKCENVFNFYVLCNKLKHLIRTGWKDWNVKGDRLESVAEHIYGTQMLAIAMYSMYKYDIDIAKVICMLAVHELEEISIGDLTLFQISKEEKEKLGHEAVSKILGNLFDKDKIMNLVIEFDERKTKESVFAYFCDKLECDLQAKLYDDNNLVDLSNQPNNISINDSEVKSLLEQGFSFSEMWLLFSQNRYNYDNNFLEVSNYALNKRKKC